MSAPSKVGASEAALRRRLHRVADSCIAATDALNEKNREGLRAARRALARNALAAWWGLLWR